MGMSSPLGEHGCKAFQGPSGQRGQGEEPTHPPWVDDSPTCSVTSGHAVKPGDRQDVGQRTDVFPGCGCARVPPRRELPRPQQGEARVGAEMGARVNRGGASWPAGENDGRYLHGPGPHGAGPPSNTRNVTLDRFPREEAPERVRAAEAPRTLPQSVGDLYDYTHLGEKRFNSVSQHSLPFSAETLEDAALFLLKEQCMRVPVAPYPYQHLVLHVSEFWPSLIEILSHCWL
ncbi:uncharacterized protein [Vicugna pacos]|uniref:Uncharacterized protein n=1 Tax=Vicugna pacos TaxID=30538 RepID=A0ABM5EHV7_VICPA